MMDKEFEVAEWLISNKDGIEELVDKKSHPAYDLFPDSVFEIYTESYSANVLNLIKKEIVSSLQLNPEEIHSIVTSELITSIFGPSIFKPNKKGSSHE